MIHNVNQKGINTRLFCLSIFFIKSIMKSLYLILSLACLFTLVFADDFSIQFFKKPNYKVEAGYIGGSVDVGGGGGAKKGNMTVESFKTQSWLQVTLYEEPYYTGASHVYKGSQKKIVPAVHVGSVKWKHL